MLRPARFAAASPPLQPPCELLAAYLGAEVQLHFEHSRPSDEPTNFAADADKQTAIDEPATSEPDTAPSHELASAWMQMVALLASIYGRVVRLRFMAG